MNLELDGKVAIVTGGSRGIGKAIARQLAFEGSDVAIIARDKQALERSARELSEETGRRVLPFTADTTQDESVRSVVREIHSTFGRIDILVNGAASPGGRSPTRLSEITTELFWEDINLKVMGYLRCAQAVAPYMIAEGWGRIINIGGLGARQVGSTVRSIRNVGVVAMTKSLANELGPSGINVTVVHPGITRTERTPGVIAEQAAASGLSVDEVERRMSQSNSLHRIVDASEIAYVVAFLASPKAVSINGELIVTSGGAGTAIYY